MEPALDATLKGGTPRYRIILDLLEIKEDIFTIVYLNSLNALI